MLWDDPIYRRELGRKLGNNLSYRHFKPYKVRGLHLRRQSLFRNTYLALQRYIVGRQPLCQCGNGLRTVKVTRHDFLAHAHIQYTCEVSPQRDSEVEEF